MHSHANGSFYSRERSFHFRATKLAEWLPCRSLFVSACCSGRATRHLLLKVAVLYGSQSGTGEGLARKVAKELKEKGHVASLHSLEGYTPAALFSEKYAIFVASTYGEGEAPESARPFYEQLCLEHFPCCENLSYAVLALGDSSYEHFCKFGIDLDNKLASLAGTRICERIDCDVDLDESFARWKGALYTQIDEIVANRPARTAPSSSVSVAGAGALQVATAPGHTRENPYLAQLVDKRALTCDVSSKLTLHLAFNIQGSDIRYEAGMPAELFLRMTLGWWKRFFTS